MFKDASESKIYKENFGAGSTVSGNWDDIYLVFSPEKQYVAILDLQTMKQVGSAVKAHDVNHLTAEEARNLVSSTIGNKLGWTYTDFELFSAGIKGINAKTATGGF